MPGPLFWGVEALGAACAVHALVKRRGSTGKAIGWSLVALVPLLGPLVYGAIHLFPAEQEESLRAPELPPSFDDD